MNRRETIMNERWTDEVLTAIAEFELHPAISVEEVQSKLQSVLPLWEGSTSGPEYDLLDLAAESLEAALHGQPQVDQRASALAVLRELRTQLMTARASTRDLTSAFLSASARKRDKYSDEARALVRCTTAAANGYFVWDLDAGEDWASIVGPSDELVAYVYALAPLVLCADRGVTAADLPARTVLATIDNLDAFILHAEPAAMSALFGDDVLEGELRVEAFSAADLWFHTV